MRGSILPITTRPTATMSPLDQWMKQFRIAEKQADELCSRIADVGTIPSSLPLEMQRHTADIRRRVAILGNRLHFLETDLSEVPKKQRMSNRDLRKLEEMLSHLSSNVKEVGAPFVMKYSSSREELIGPSEKGAEVEINEIAEMENHEIVEVQRQVMKEQDKELDKLEEAIVSTRHVALAINEELDLQTRLIDDLGQGVEETSTRLERVQKRLKSLSKHLNKDGSSKCMLLSVIAIIICVAVIWALIK